jgi:hypothetical protein
MTTIRLIVGLAAFACLSACASLTPPETKLLGRWQEDFVETQDPHQLYVPVTGIQLEFLGNGNVVLNERRGQGGWAQERTGTYGFVDSSHLKLDFGTAALTDRGPRMYMDEVPRIYEIAMTDQSGLTLRTSDGAFKLVRVK